jgi:sulfur relay (sulfurtransferase) DsrC/TusE family protein
MGSLNILGSQLRRHYLSLGPDCIRDEKIWQEMVESILSKEGIAPITPRHRQVMSIVRKSYLERERAPSVRELCTLAGLTLSDFFALYPDWPHTLFIVDSIVSQVLGIPIWQMDC